jgi:hypothetical protein
MILIVEQQIDIPNDATDHNLFAKDAQLLETFNIPKSRKSSELRIKIMECMQEYKFIYCKWQD